MADFTHILQAQRDRGGWIPADAIDVRSVVDEWVKTGLPFPPALARIDLLFWMDRGDVKPYRYYAKRWGWGPKKAYNLMVSIGLIGSGQREQEGSSEGAAGEQEGSRIPADHQEINESGSSEGAAGEQEGSSEGAVYPDSDSDSDKRIVGSASARVEAPPPPEKPPEVGATRPPPIDPFDPQQHRPDEHEIRGAAGAAGVPADEAVKIADFYESRGWIDRNGNPIRHWMKAIKAAYESGRRTTRSHGRVNQQAPSGQPRTVEDISDTYDRYVAEAEEFDRRRRAGDGSVDVDAEIDPD